MKMSKLLPNFWTILKLGRVVRSRFMVSSQLLTFTILFKPRFVFTVDAASGGFIVPFTHVCFPYFSSKLLLIQYFLVGSALGF